MRVSGKTKLLPELKIEPGTPGLEPSALSTRLSLHPTWYQRVIIGMGTPSTWKLAIALLTLSMKEKPVFIHFVLPANTNELFWTLVVLNRIIWPFTDTPEKLAEDYEVQNWAKELGDAKLGGNFAVSLSTNQQLYACDMTMKYLRSLAH